MKRLTALLVFIAALFFVLPTSVNGQTKINPKTQIGWPASCGIYNVATGACYNTTTLTYPVFNATTGFQINGTAPLNHCLLGNGTNYVDSASCGGGGGGSPGVPNLSFQFNNSSSFAGSGAITTDAAFQAIFINATNPTPGTSACGATPVLCVAGIWNSPTQAAAAADPIGISVLPTFAYPAYNWGNPGAGGWSTVHGTLVNATTYSRGISQTESSELIKYAIGDAANYHYVFSYGGAAAESDEGVSANSSQTIQLNNFFKGTVNGTQTTGATMLTSTQTGGGPTGDGSYLINRTSGAVTGGHFATSAIITAWTYDGVNTFVFTASNSLVVGQTVTVYGFPTSTWINAVGTVIAANSTQFTLQSAVTHASGSGTELGVAYFIAFPVSGTAAVAQQVAGITLTPTSARGTLNATTATITAWSIAGNVATFTATNTYVAGETVLLSAFGTSTFFNYNPGAAAAPGTPFGSLVVLSSGLSGSQFKANFVHANGSATEAGTATVGMPTYPTSPLVFTTTVDITDTVSAFPTTPNLVGCLTGGQPEQVLFTAQAAGGGHQAVSITYRQPHLVPQISEPATLWYGGPCGTFIDQLQQTASSRGAGALPSTYFVVGALDTTHLVYAWNVHGGTAGNRFPTYTIPTPYSGVLRTGSTVTGTIAGGGDPAVFNSQAAVSVIATTNSVFLGAGTTATATLSGIGTPQGISFTQSGSNGDTATEIIVTLPTSFDNFSLYCGAEITQPSTPSPGSPTTIFLEPNSCAWTAADVIWNPPHPTWNANGVFNVMQQYTPSNADFSNGIGMVISGPGIDSEFIPFNAQFTNSSDMYQGHGGTLLPPTFMNIQGDGGSLSGQPTTPLGTIFRIQNSGIGGAPVIRIDSDEFGTNLTMQNLITVENGNLRYYNPTATWYLNNLDVGNLTVHGSQSLPAFIASNVIRLGDTSDLGVLEFTNSNTGSPITANLQHCNPFANDAFIGVNAAAGNCNQAIGGYLPNGALGTGDLYAINTATLNNLQVGRGTPINVPSSVYSGTAGSTIRSYVFVIENAAGQEGSQGTGGIQFSVVGATASTLDGSHFVTLTCPSALQYGLSSGDTYVAYSQNIGSGAWTRVGTCPVTSTLVDNGAASSVAGPPVYDANATLATGNVILPPTAGTIQWLTDIYHPTTFSAGISETAGVISFDSGTPGNGGAATIQTRTTLVPKAFSALPTCNSGAEGTMQAVIDSTTNTWGATITGSGTDHVLAYCDGTNWTVGAK